MIEIKDLIKAELIEKFSERVAFNKIERILYSSDLGSLPAVVTNRIHTVPDAVVQPRDNSELISLTDLASRNNIPLVPRGGGSAGYGGAVPTKRGIVVDFSRMNKIIKIDNENLIYYPYQSFFLEYENYSPGTIQFSPI